jgi:hypothetical protein
LQKFQKFITTGALRSWAVVVVGGGGGGGGEILKF